MIYDVIMPKQGLQMTEGVIVEWLYSEGDFVFSGKPLFVIETDKSEIKIDAQHDGVLIKILAEEGETVTVAKTIAYISDSTDDLLPEVLIQNKKSDIQKENEKDSIKKEINRNNNIIGKNRIFITPRAKKLTIKNNINYDYIKGSGYKGIIIESDIIKEIENNKNIIEKPLPQKFNNTNQSSVSCVYHKVIINIKEINKLCENFNKNGINCTIFDFILYAANKNLPEDIICKAFVNENNYNLLYYQNKKSFSEFIKQTPVKPKNNSVIAISDLSDKNINESILPVYDEMKAILCAGAVHNGKIVLTMNYNQYKIGFDKAIDYLNKIKNLIEVPSLLLII